MDWTNQDVVRWLNEIGLSKYNNKFQGYSMNGAILMQMDEFLLDDLEVTEVNDRQILLSEVAKLSSLKTEVPQTTLHGKYDSLSHVNSQLQASSQTPVVTVGDFDHEDEDDEQKLDPISDDEDFGNNQETDWDEEFQRNYSIINLSYNGNDNGSERELRFTDSDENHNFGICDKGNPEEAVVASRATKMVELLSRDNVALKEKLENMYLKIDNLQVAESEFESMCNAYHELQVSCRERESLEWSARKKMERELEELLKSNKELQDEILDCKNQVQEDKKSLDKHRSDLQLKNNVIQQLISQNNSFVSTRDDLENTINQQRRQIEELLKDKEQLYSQLVQSQERTAYLQKELQTRQASPQRKAQGKEKGTVKKGTGWATEEKTTNHKHTNSTDEGIAELDGPTNVPILFEMLKEKDETILMLEDKLFRLEQTLQQEGTSRNLAIRAASMPKEARIAALEKSIQESEKIIAEYRGQNLKSIEELYVANRRCADLEAIIKSLHVQLAEKSARIRILQNNVADDDSDEPKEPEWPLDPGFSRTDFAHMRDLARDSYAESLDSGMSLATTTDTRLTEPEFKTTDESDQVSVHFWSV